MPIVNILVFLHVLSFDFCTHATKTASLSGFHSSSFSSWNAGCGRCGDVRCSRSGLLGVCSWASWPVRWCGCEYHDWTLVSVYSWSTLLYVSELCLLSILDADDSLMLLLLLRYISTAVWQTMARQGLFTTNLRVNSDSDETFSLYVQVLLKLWS